MTPTNPAGGRGVKLPVAAITLLASSVIAPLCAQSIPNPSFEGNTFTVFPGDVASNGAITGWTTTTPSQVGVVSSGSVSYANNGAIPNGTNVAFMRAGNASGLAGAAVLKTTATGLTIGTKYNVSMRVNARSGATVNIPRLVFSTNGTGEPMKSEVAKVSSTLDTTAYRTVAFEFTATATSQDITLTNERTTGDHTILIDDLKITASQNVWSYHPWTSDADSGIDSQYVYTHTVNLASNTPTTVNGVLFLGHDFTAERRLQATGFTGVYTFGAGLPQVTGDSLVLAQTFGYSGSQSLTLQNLKPNTQYKFSIYGIGFDAVGAEGASPTRSATFSSGLATDKYTVDLNHYGQYKGIVVDYTYTTDAQGSDVVISLPSIGGDTSGALNTFHTSAISNREVVARTAAPTWTTSAWTGDADSGISGTYVYTHAININSTLAPVVNGVQFTPLATGATTPTYSNNLPSSVADAVTNITGTSADLSHGFAYNAYPEIQKLTGLTPGKQYVFSLYSVGWDASAARKALIKADPGDGGTIVDQSEFGLDNGIRFDHTYTAGADGVFLATFSTVDGSTLTHHYAITNREATPMVGVAPTITLAPQGTTLALGDNYTLRVGITGSPNLAYQWKKNNVNINGATSSTYDITNATASSAGSYTVTVTNSSGTVTTTAVTIDVRELAQGHYSTGFGGDGMQLAGGAVDPHFTIITNPDVPASTEAIVQTGIPGAWLANSGTSMWIGPRANTANSVGGNYVYRTKIDLTGFTLSTVQITGRWASDNAGTSIKVNDVVVPGQANDTGTTYANFKSFTINLANTPGLTAGVNNLDFYVNNELAGYTGLLVDSLKVIGTIPAGTAPHIVTAPQSTTVMHGQQVTLYAAANGSAPLTYSWLLNDTVIPNQTGATLDFTADTLAAAGTYKVKVTNSAGNTTSTGAVVSFAANNNPVVPDYEATTDKGVALTIDALTLLSTATDPDNDTVDIGSVASTSSRGGTVTYSAGTITYTPPANVTGLDAFTYVVNDGIWGGTTTGTVYVTVNATSTAGGAPTVPLKVTLSGGAASGNFTGTPNASYVIQRSTDLSTWTDLPAVTAGADGVAQFTDSAPPAGKAFYRIVYTTP